jgi:hypothetical protein
MGSNSDESACQCGSYRITYKIYYMNLHSHKNYFNFKTQLKLIALHKCRPQTESNTSARWYQLEKGWVLLAEDCPAYYEIIVRDQDVHLIRTRYRHAEVRGALKAHVASLGKPSASSASVSISFNCWLDCCKRCAKL